MTEAQKYIRQWRVGSLSMGVLLILLGIALLAGAFDQSRTLAGMLKYWPILLIMLGLELTALNILANLRSLNYRLTYDFLSIFLVLLLTFGSAVMVVLDSAGIMDLAQRSVTVSQRHLEAEKVSVAAADLKNVSINAQGRRITLRSYQGSEVKVSIIYRGYFASEAEARDYADSQYVRSEQAGDILYLDIFPANHGRLPNNYVEQEVIILVPETLNLTLGRVRGEFQVDIPRLQANWILDSQGYDQPLVVNLGTANDLKLLVDSGKDVAGNIPWDSNDEEGRADKTWGGGRYQLVIRSRGQVTINAN